MSPSHPTSNLPPFGRPADVNEYTDEQFKAIVFEKLAGGNRAFQDMRDKIDQTNSTVAVLQEGLKPKPPEWGKLLAIAFTIATSVITLVWTARGMVMERPTRDELERALEQRTQVIDDLELEVKGLREQWVDHAAQIKALSAQIESLASGRRGAASP